LTLLSKTVKYMHTPSQSIYVEAAKAKKKVSLLVEKRDNIDEQATPENREDTLAMDKVELLHDAFEVGPSPDFSLEALIDWSKT